MRELKLVGAAVLTLLIGAAPTLAHAQQTDAEQTPDWGTYGNSKYNYTVCYPTKLLKPGREADNGDGLVFTGKNGATMRVWGTANTLEWTPTSAKNWRMGYLAKDGVDLTYTRQSKNFFVLSGTRKGSIVYHKSVLENDLWRIVEFRYKAKDRAIWDPIVTQVASCLDSM